MNVYSMLVCLSSSILSLLFFIYFLLHNSTTSVLLMMMIIMILMTEKENLSEADGERLQPMRKLLLMVAAFSSSMVHCYTSLRTAYHRN